MLALKKRFNKGQSDMDSRFGYFFRIQVFYLIVKLSGLYVLKSCLYGLKIHHYFGMSK